MRWKEERSDISMIIKELMRVLPPDNLIDLRERKPNNIYPDSLFTASCSSKVWNLYSDREVLSVGRSDRNDVDLFITIKY